MRAHILRPLKLITTYQKHKGYQNAFDRLGKIGICLFLNFDPTTKMYLSLVVPLKQLAFYRSTELHN